MRIGGVCLQKEIWLEEQEWKYGRGLMTTEQIRTILRLISVGNTRAYSRWVTLTNALAGLFCASLNFVDSTRTISPALSFRPAGHHPEGIVENLHSFHGALPREPVCTENLTPFLKLLPCKGRAGISSLLDGHRLFDSPWQAMALDVRPVCEGDECYVEMVQNVDMVIDVERSIRRNSITPD